MKANLKNLKGVFNQMKRDGVDIYTALRWNFFFFDLSIDKIENLYKWFETNENHMLEIYQIEDDKYWCLKTSIFRVYSAEELHKQNKDFNKLVVQLGIELYDGWDVDV